MKDDIIEGIAEFYKINILDRIIAMWEHPLDLILFIIDSGIVLFLVYKILKIAKDSRAWQLLKGIILLLLITWISGVLRLNILHAILDKVVLSWGILALIIIFQPEIRRALEQLGTSKMKKFFGFTEDIETKTKEDIYKIVIAAEEMSKRQIGALIVIERDIGIKDIVDTGIIINAEVSPQLLTNITWPIVFFAFKWRFIAIIWIIVLLILIIYMTAIFYKKNKLAGLLQIPYIIWTIFATYLTIGAYVLNR